MTAVLRLRAAQETLDFASAAAIAARAAYLHVSTPATQEAYREAVLRAADAEMAFTDAFRAWLLHEAPFPE